MPRQVLQIFRPVRLAQAIRERVELFHRSDRGEFLLGAGKK